MKVEKSEASMWQQMNESHTLFVEIEDGGEVIATDHSFFTISNITVSPCPGI